MIRFLLIMLLSFKASAMGEWDHYFMLCYETNNTSMPPVVYGPYVEESEIDAVVQTGRCAILLVEINDNVGNSVFYKIDTTIQI